MPVKMGTYEDPYEKKIEDARKAGKILSPKDFADKNMRDALVRLNKKNQTKNDTAEQMHDKYEKETKAKPFVYKKGGEVKKGGKAIVHTGEKVLTKAQAGKMKDRGKQISCKR